MGNTNMRIAVTGLGIHTPGATGVEMFTTSLKEGITSYRTVEFRQEDGAAYQFPMAVGDGFDAKAAIEGLDAAIELKKKAKGFRNISESASMGIYCALEAWVNAGLHEYRADASRMAIISGGSNTQQASLGALQNEYRNKLNFLKPTYALNLFDTDLVGMLSELFGIKGCGYTIGAASASGNMAIIQAAGLINSGGYDIVVVVAPLMELSVYELQGFSVLGAMAVLQEGKTVSGLCRPFDAGHAGFVYGKSAACVILESEEHARKRKQNVDALLVGFGTSMDANRNPNPSAEGERLAMLGALHSASIRPGQIDYVNTHGSSSAIGDMTEIEALLAAGLAGAQANSTKSITGHGLSAAGLVECVASVIQMRNRFIHGNYNLEDPVTDQIKFPKQSIFNNDINYCMSNSFGFGGINTSIILQKNTYIN